jgi:hypothetical protein
LALEALRDEAGRPRLLVLPFAEPDAERDAAIVSKHPQDRVLIVYTGVPVGCG